MKEVKLKLINSLLEILQLDITNLLKQFVEGEIALLFLLYRKQSSLSPTEIAKELAITKGRVASLLNSLIEKEEVDVAIDQQDRRKFNISIAPKGLKVLEEKILEADKSFDYVIDKLGEEKTRALVDILDSTVNIQRGK